MFELLWFFKGAVTIADYEAMSWARRETAFSWMKFVQREQQKANAKKARRRG